MNDHRLLTRGRTVWSAAIVLGLGVASIGIWSFLHRRHDTVETQVRSLAEATRTARFLPLRGRLSPPFSPIPHRPSAAEIPIAIRAAAAALVLNASDDPEAQHGKGVALVVSRDLERAVPELAAAAKRIDSADAWNDYSAALLAEADEQGTTKPALDAFIATEAALRHEPTHAAARFNRALALEDLGLLDEALANWRVLDTQSPANAEVSSNIARIEETLKRSGDWRSRISELRLAVERNDAAGVRRIVAAFRRDARAWGEGMFPSMWAESFERGDFAGAEASLAVARAIGDALREVSGELLLADSVRRIDSATTGDRHVLARAYLAYRDGRMAHQRSDAMDAERLLREAARGFARAESPMEAVAQYYVASSLYMQSRTTEALTMLEALAARRFDGQGYKALAAQIGWERGLCYLVRGSFSSALDTFEESRRRFAQLGEPGMTASFDEFIAATYDFMGDEEQAWEARRAAFDVFSRTGDASRKITALETATRSMLMRDDFARALPLLNLAAHRASALDDAVRMTEALLQRSIAHTRLAQAGEARHDIAEVRQWISRIPDARTRSAFEIDGRFAEAAAIAGSDPRAAMALLGKSIDSARQSGRTVFAAQLLFERGRLARGLGDATARDDFSAALNLIEQQRVTAADLDQRASVAHAAKQLFEDAIELALADRDFDGAFALAERSKARALLDSLSERSGELPSVISRSELSAALAGDSAVIEYVALHDATVAFVVTPTDFRAVTLPAGDDWAALIEPLLPMLRGVSELAIVPNRRQSDVRFAALVSPTTHRRLIDDFRITLAPSASIAIRCARSTTPRVSRGMLAIAATDFDRATHRDLRPIDGAGREARAVAAGYPDATVLAAAAATPGALRAQMPRASIVHYAGHALARPRRPLDSTLVLAPSADPELSASEIARLDLRNTQLVFLSACRSGIAGSADDGVQSLATAFLVAGVPAIIASTTDLDDEAATKFAERFHQEYRATRNVSRAFQSAVRLSPGTDRSMVLLGGSPSLLREKRRSS